MVLSTRWSRGKCPECLAPGVTRSHRRIKKLSSPHCAPFYRSELDVPAGLRPLEALGAGAVCRVWIDSMQVEQEPEQQKTWRRRGPFACRSAARARDQVLLIASHRGPQGIAPPGLRSAPPCGQVPCPVPGRESWPGRNQKLKSALSAGMGHSRLSEGRRPNQAPGAGSRDSLAANCVDRRES